MRNIENSKLESAYKRAEDTSYLERNSTYDGYVEGRELLKYVSKDSSFPQYRNRRIALQCYRCIYDKLTPAREWPTFVLGEYLPELVTTKDGKLTEKEKKELIDVVSEVLTYPSEKKITLNDFNNAIAFVEMYFYPASNNPYNVLMDLEFAGDILKHIEMAVDAQLFYQNLSAKDKRVLVDRVALLLYRQTLLYQRLGLTCEAERLKDYLEELEKDYRFLCDEWQ